MKKGEHVKYDSVVEYKGKRWFIYDWCGSCNFVWIVRFDKKKRVRYTDLNLLLL